MDFTRLAASFLVILVSCASIYRAQDESSVYFALMVSSAPTLNTSGVVSAVDQALEVVNGAESNILPGLRLRYTSVLDTQVSTKVSSQVYNSP